MSRDEATQAAAEYLKKQAAIMKQYGHAPKLSGENYRQVLSDTAKTFRSLSTLGADAIEKRQAK